MFKLVMMLMLPSFVFKLYFVIKLTLYVDDNFRPLKGTEMPKREGELGNLKF